MRILTWNVERPMNKATSSGKSVDQISLSLREKILTFEPDIAIITETHKSLQLGGEYQSLSTTYSKRKPLDGESVAAVFSRWPMEQIDTFDPTEAVAAKIAHPKMQLIVYGSIIVYFNYRGVDGLSPQHQEQLKSIEQHGEDWRSIRVRFPDYEMITGGDYNAKLNADSENFQRKVNLLEQVKLSGLTTLTDNSFGILDKRPKGTIDHICVTEGLVRSPNAYDWFDGEVSDHSIVVVDLDV